MTKIRDISPKKEAVSSVGRAMRPFTHSMEEFFENFLPRRWMNDSFEADAWRRPFRRDWEGAFEAFPRVDMVDKGDVLVVRAEMPGVDKDNLEILISGDRLTIEASRKFQEEEKEETYFRNEMAYGRIYRTMHLPVAIKGNEAKAELKDGILEILLPKVEAVTPFTVKVA
ncbi:MAG: Hsp20/alpha crystallin family protein [Gammaproteobacteria bacterium]|nr:Hsp20/alpha crystallin family protein [Gammaproteobacteria bacterium]MDH4313320.1 Hsp20/alpha crystallin family protein [Gammaproteobacteria bacterium]MDH5214691.1 Hsp20/alpha crystallin family protein [Gammaproteobacteria bacterium]